MKELLGPSSKLDSSRSYNYLALVVSAPILKLIDWVPYLHPLKFLNNFVAQLYKHLEKFCYFLFQYLDTLLSSRCYKLFEEILKISISLEVLKKQQQQQQYLISVIFYSLKNVCWKNSISEHFYADPGPYISFEWA